MRSRHDERRGHEGGPPGGRVYATHEGTSETRGGEVPHVSEEDFDAAWGEMSGGNGNGPGDFSFGRSDESDPETPRGSNPTE